MQTVQIEVSPVFLVLILALLCVCVIWLWRLDAAFNKEKLRIYGAATAATRGLHEMLRAQPEVLADTPKLGKELLEKLFGLFQLDAEFLWAHPPVDSVQEGSGCSECSGVPDDDESGPEGDR